MGGEPLNCLHSIIPPQITDHSSPSLQARIFPPGCPKAPLCTSIPILAPYHLDPNAVGAIRVPSSTGVLGTPCPVATLLCGGARGGGGAELHQTEGKRE